MTPTATEKTSQPSSGGSKKGLAAPARTCRARGVTVICAVGARRSTSRLRAQGHTGRLPGLPILRPHHSPRAFSSGAVRSVHRGRGGEDSRSAECHFARSRGHVPSSLAQLMTYGACGERGPRVDAACGGATAASRVQLPGASGGRPAAARRAKAETGLPDRHRADGRARPSRRSPGADVIQIGAPTCKLPVASRSWAGPGGPCASSAADRHGRVSCDGGRVTASEATRT